MSLLGGKKPQRRLMGGAESALIKATDRMATQRAGLTNIANRYGDSLALGRKAERRDMLGVANADVNQAIGAAGPARTNAGALDRAMVRGKGLSRLFQAQSNEFDSQLLRDRITFTGMQQSRRGQGLAGLEQAMSLHEGMSQTRQAASDMNYASRANLAGTVAGIGAGFAHNAFMNSRARQQQAAVPPQVKK